MVIMWVSCYSSRRVDSRTCAQPFGGNRAKMEGSQNFQPYSSVDNARHCPHPSDNGAFHE